MAEKPQPSSAKKAPKSKWEAMTEKSKEEALIETLKTAEQAHDRDLSTADDTAEVEAELAREETEAEAEVERITDVDELHQMLEDAQAKIKDYYEKLLRAQAESTNARRIADRDVANARKFALERFANELLAVVDSIERALEQPHDGDEKMQAFVKGVEMTHALFLRVLEKFGIKQLNPVGETFNPDFHEAIQMQPSKDAKPNTILTVMQRGYTLNERLLRPAMVVVSQ